MNKTLIVYGTRKGTTTETVILIADTLRRKFSHSVDVSDRKHLKYYKKKLAEYDNIIIGSSIVSGRWKSKVLSFAKKDIFVNKRIAVFVTAGGTLNKVAKYGLAKEEAVNEAIEKYIDKYKSKFKFSPVSKTAFGGKVIKKGNIKYNSWNREDILKWSIDLGEKLNNKNDSKINSEIS